MSEANGQLQEALRVIDFVPPAESPLPPISVNLSPRQRQTIIRGFIKIESVQREIIDQHGILPEKQMYLLNSAVGLLQLLILENRNAKDR